jgi:hypothetical protein
MTEEAQLLIAGAARENVSSGDPGDGPVEVGRGDRRCHADQFVQRVGEQQPGHDRQDLGFQGGVVALIGH